MNFSIGSFIRCWDVTVGSLVKNLANKTLPVNMKEDIQQEKLLRLGKCLLLEIFCFLIGEISVFKNVAK